MLLVVTVSELVKNYLPTWEINSEVGCIVERIPEQQKEGHIITKSQVYLPLQRRRRQQQQTW